MDKTPQEVLCKAVCSRHSLCTYICVGKKEKAKLAGFESTSKKLSEQIEAIKAL